jgi:GNAT superfamily N-acetyltransferase
MTVADSASCSAVLDAALNDLRSRLGLSPKASNPADTASIAHLCQSDSGGSWVATDQETIVGFAQAAKRERLWVLAHLFVAPETQGHNVGSLLLDRAIGYSSTAAGIIASTPDPRAIRAYAQLGFDAHPTLTASGALDRSSLPAVEGVREGDERDLDFADDVDRRLRGGPHGCDARFLMTAGARLIVAPNRGYALTGEAGPLIVAAIDEPAARVLTLECLASAAAPVVVLKRLTSVHQWAIQLAIQLRLELRPWGPLLTLNSSAANSIGYLADSAFC